MKTKAVFGMTAVAALLAWTGAAQVVDTVITNGLFEPHSVAVDTNNNFYITDSANNRIVKFVPDTAALSSLAGLKGSSGYKEGFGIQARFFDPKGIIYVPSRDGLVVADSGNHVLSLVKLNGAVSLLAGQPNVPGRDNGTALSATFRFPSGLAADANGNIYIADAKNNAIRKLDTSDNVTTLAPGLPDEFYEPAAVAVGDNGRIYVADTRNHSIKIIETDGAVTLLAGSNSRFVSGTDDSVFALNALFTGPAGLLWLGGSAGLLISDTGNHSLRRIFFNPSSDVNDNSVETFAGTPGLAGFVNGAPLVAKFSNPIGLDRDKDNGGFVVVDLANSAVRRIQTSTPLPPVKEPVIGWVDFVKDAFGQLVSKLVPVTQSVFNDEVIIAILPEAGTETFFTFGDSPPSPLEDHIPSPSRLTGLTPPPYENGLTPDQVAPSMINPQPDVTIKAIGTQDGRRPSTVVQARFQFKTANSVIQGDNPNSFVVQNQTSNARMYYTTNGVDDPVIGETTTLGPLISGAKLSFHISSNLTFRVRAFRANFKPSEIIQKIFIPSNAVPNQITFGFDSGEASSEFVGSAGQRFFAPVTLNLLPKQTIYAMQFNLTVTNLNGPPVDANSMGFFSTLKKPVPGTDPPVYLTIPNAMFAGFELETFNVTNSEGKLVELVRTNDFYTDLIFTNATQNLLGVGWLERKGGFKLYDTKLQDLVTFSKVHDTLFQSVDGKVVAGGFSFVIPITAKTGDLFSIKIDRPSATEDGIAADAFIEAPTDGSVGGGKMNGLKNVTVGQRRYTVGDVAPFRWFNAGDFGEGNLLNNDVLQVFQSAIYGNSMPPEGSDLFDAMDASDGLSNAIFDGNDLTINSITLGDGGLQVDDVFVTFRRSLDPTLKWFARYWQDGVRVVVEVPNIFRGQPAMPAERLTNRQAATPAEEGSNDDGLPTSVTFNTGEVMGNPGETIVAPITAQIMGKYPIRVLMLNLNVQPTDIAPALAEAVQFKPVADLGQPTVVSSREPANYAAAWLDNTVSGVRGTNLIGNLLITIPSTAPANSAYKIEFEHISASPNGLALFPQSIKQVILSTTVTNSTGDPTGTNTPAVSSWGDGIPDFWRVQYFSSATNELSTASADPDGDGISNLAEFRAGTNPTDNQSALRLSIKPNPGSAGFSMRWKTVAGKTYVLECSPSLSEPNWRIITANIAGTDGDKEIADNNPATEAQFYRVRQVE